MLHAMYREILEIGLPYFIEKKKKFGYFSRYSAEVFINFLATDYDSHILRKFGNDLASKFKKLQITFEN